MSLAFGRQKVHRLTTDTMQMSEWQMRIRKDSCRASNSDSTNWNNFGIISTNWLKIFTQNYLSYLTCKKISNKQMRVGCHIWTTCCLRNSSDVAPQIQWFQIKISNILHYKQCTCTDVGFFDQQYQLLVETYEWDHPLFLFSYRYIRF